MGIYGVGLLTESETPSRTLLLHLPTSAQDHKAPPGQGRDLLLLHWGFSHVSRRRREDDKATPAQTSPPGLPQVTDFNLPGAGGSGRGAWDSPSGSRELRIRGEGSSARRTHKPQRPEVRHRSEPRC